MKLTECSSIFLRSDIKKLILGLLNKNDLEKISNRSVAHDNGFKKIVLKERENDSDGIRIHHWKAGTSDSNIHTHRWNMTSFILDGGYTASEYEESEEGTLFYHYQFQSLKDKNYLLRAVEKTALKRIVTKHYSKFDEYTMDKGSIHQINSVSDKGALTIVTSNGIELEFADVYSKKQIATLESSQRKLSIVEVEECMKLVLTTLSQFPQ